MSPTTANRVFQSFIDDAVARGVAPGFQCVVFDRDSLVFNGVSGFASAPSETVPEGKPFKPETVVVTASCTKIAVSLIALHIIDRGLAKSGFSLKDLDSHEALIKVLPEFKHGSGSLVTKIIEGFEDKLGPDGRKVMKLRDAKGEVTLRMLLSHTAGMAYDWNQPYLAELYRPSDGSVPHNMNPRISGAIRDFEIPLVAEPNSTYCYSHAADWVGQFAVRSSGKNLRQLFKEILFEFLKVPPSEADLWLSPAMKEELAEVHVRDPNRGFAPIPYPGYAPEDGPEESKAYWASGGVYASMQAYSKVLQAVLNQDPGILSKEVWELALKDDLKDRGIKVPRPEWKSSAPTMVPDVDEFSKSTAEHGVGVSILQCKIATAPTLSGRSTGSLTWAGLPNVYYFIDPVKGVGAIFGAQLLPFCDAPLVKMRDEFETLVYKTIATG